MTAVRYFMGVRASFPKGRKAEARTLLDAVNAALCNGQLPRYVEPRSLPNVNGSLGKATCDQDPAHSIAQLGKFGMQRGSRHLRSLFHNPYRAVFVPIPFPVPLNTRCVYKVWPDESPVQVQVGSSQSLLAELKGIASDLGIELRREDIPAVLIPKLNHVERFHKREDGNLAHLRCSWLRLHEAAKVSIEYDVALALADSHQGMPDDGCVLPGDQRILR